ncbi:type I phosphodiesterase/nucleotide pyrophosphatase [Leptospira broomii serovar Hurstbridge str. 5399]|uniref:Type I phosphodiesterase/nucleotide pyrophosphatase n=1 Tax=Leptospira broomii serovar Hurstbridge str. 5399 TaxID=1049789 RepID=T0GN41_9LEPT|nr:alkaline phosphatase family protein [Leptospira broomii]EQA46758.1 type I phosphodiesterase/nucleotide pyrophosphatase [Leptospira broomii serovar Hurstbridge str. 5399]
MRRFKTFFVIFAVTIAYSSVFTAPSSVAPIRPKLVVVISVDQLASSLIDPKSLKTWGGEFTRGFKTLQQEGVYFTNSYHAHGFTETGPGHSVILSGRFPTHTKITQNSWTDPENGEEIYCVTDKDTDILNSKKKGTGASPKYFSGTTLGDWFLSQIPNSRVYTFAGKDRAAVLMGGTKPSGAFWFDEESFTFTTSTFYGKELPEWLESYNKKVLNRFSEDITWKLPAHRNFNSGKYQVGTYSLNTGANKAIYKAGSPLDKSTYLRYRASPFFDDAVIEGAIRLIEEEKLGQGETTDLIAIGLSATDYIGHGFGNQGPEMRDQLLHLDEIIGTFIDKIRMSHPDAWIVLTADHGAPDLSERLLEVGKDANRIDPDVWRRKFVREVAARLGTGEAELFWKIRDPSQIYIRPKYNLDKAGVTKEKVITASLEVLKTMQGVLTAISSDEIQKMDPPSKNDPDQYTIKERLRLSYVPDRSGDILVAFKEYTTVGDTDKFEYLVHHGSPHDYDRKVPLIFLGPWKAKKVSKPTKIVDLAPTLAKYLGLKQVDKVDGQILPLE